MSMDENIPSKPVRAPRRAPQRAPEPPSAPQDAPETPEFATIHVATPLKDVEIKGEVDIAAPVEAPEPTGEAYTLAGLSTLLYAGGGERGIRSRVRLPSVGSGIRTAIESGFTADSVVAAWDYWCATGRTAADFPDEVCRAVALGAPCFVKVVREADLTHRS